MNMNDNHSSSRILMIAAIAGALGVTIGAFGAHGLENALGEFGSYDESELTPELVSKRVDQFDVGARYHLVHSAALLALAGVRVGSDRRRMISAWLMTVGIILFSGSLYLLVLTNTPWLGAVTPLGGLSWIAAWVSLLGVAFSNRCDTDAP